MSLSDNDINKLADIILHDVRMQNRIISAMLSRSSSEKEAIMKKFEEMLDEKIRSKSFDLQVDNVIALKLEGVKEAIDRSLPINSDMLEDSVKSIFSDAPISRHDTGYGVDLRSRVAREIVAHVGKRIDQAFYESKFSLRKVVRAAILAKLNNTDSFLADYVSEMMPSDWREDDYDDD
jgi:hypothetical protein